jgi:hypothetical protein
VNAKGASGLCFHLEVASAQSTLSDATRACALPPSRAPHCRVIRLDQLGHALADVAPHIAEEFIEVVDAAVGDESRSTMTPHAAAWGSAHSSTAHGQFGEQILAQRKSAIGGVLDAIGVHDEVQIGAVVIHGGDVNEADT